MLNKITIDNFKSLKHLEYDCAGLNLLTGMNGAGKSSFIQMLRMMREISRNATSLHFEMPASSIGPEFCAGDFKYCYRDAREINFSVDFTLATEGAKRYSYKRVVSDNCMSSESDGGALVAEHPDWKRHYVDCYGEHLSLQSKMASGKYISGEQLDAAEAKGDAAFEKAEAEMRDGEDGKAFAAVWSGMRFIDAFRLPPTDIHEGGRYSRLVALFDGLSDQSFNAEGQNAAEYILKSGLGASKDGNALLDKINACLDWVSPGAKLSVRGKNVGGREFILESVGFGKDAAARQYKPQNVGFGISYILPVLVTLLSAEPGSILIIENPEAHLHPRGQSEIGKLIAETVARGVQVFVETHSDHVINGVRVAVKKGVVKPEDVNIAFFERKPHDVTREDGTPQREIYSEVTNIKVDANGSLSEWPKDFMDEWGIQQMKLLRP